MYLTDKLAAQIIDSIMYLVNYQMYITDKNGIILAAKDYSQIGAFNLAAAQAVQTSSPQQVSPGQHETFPACSPGIILPLKSDGYAIGALGIIGQADAVKDAAVMAIKIAELLIEREILQQEVRSRYQLRDQFIGLVIAGFTSRQDITRIADMLQFDLTIARMVVVINFLYTPPSSGKKLHSQNYFDRTCESARYLVQNSTFVTSADLVGLWDQRLIILKHIPGKTKKADQWCTDLLSFLSGIISDITVQLGVGSFVDEYSRLPTSYQQARFCLRKCGNNDFTSIYDFSILTEYFFANHEGIKDLHPIEIVRAKINSARLIEKYDIANTILVLISHNFSLVPTAKSLYIHRNTLLSRLKKLKEITNLDPCHSFEHAVVCKILFSGNKLRRD